MHGDIKQIVRNMLTELALELIDLSTQIAPDMPDLFATIVSAQGFLVAVCQLDLITSVRRVGRLVEFLFALSK